MTQLLPFQFKYHSNGRVLLVNECGDYAFVPQDTFEDIISDRLAKDNSHYLDLQSRLFLKSAENDEFSLQKAAAKYRSRKAYLRDFTSLHMMVVTLRCNQRCEYCQVSCADEDARKYDMPVATAYKIVDTIFASPSNSIKIEFQGGEPTLHWDVVKETVLYAKEKQQNSDKGLSFVLCTNLTGITRKQLIFCRDHNIYISTSLDGTRPLHDKNRVLRAGGSSYDLFLRNLFLAREIVGKDCVDALMTTTALSLGKLHEIIDEYIALGFNGIFIRSLNPYGFAAEQAGVLGYDTHDFVDAYANALQYILSINKTRFFPEYFASILLSRILTPFSTGFVDLQSPAGVGISGAIYDYDGSVYPSDEARMLARMGDGHFNLGNVHTDSYKDIFGGPKLKDIIHDACVEVTPSCAYCVYQAYCGTDPVRNYLESGSEVRKMEGTPFCIKHKGIFNYLFSLLADMSEEEENIIWSWITRSNTVDCYA
ncbi:MAG: His-Xaa-Ser system radical SAM maturase HxsB [Desulfovibrio sp.]|jgi:His-Xaa-Ser system radical SAM maturase HxsB|nr:His-Xaa-Ser system radical SAM maturase HxsB [Desulfovibrio sp.]